MNEINRYSHTHIGILSMCVCDAVSNPLAQAHTAQHSTAQQKQQPPKPTKHLLLLCCRCRRRHRTQAQWAGAHRFYSLLCCFASTLVNL